MKPSRELDALIAVEVMDLAVTRSSVIRPGFPDTPIPLPHYSTEIADAWKVVERMTELGYIVKLDGEYDFMYARVVRQVRMFKVNERDVVCPYSELRDTPVSICLVALKALGHATQD